MVFNIVLNIIRRRVMGWCSGTKVFDSMIGALVEDDPLDKKEAIKELIKTLEDLDWDCQCDSEYLQHPLVKEAFIELDPDWEEYFEEYRE